MSKLSDKLDLKKDFPGASYDEWKLAAEKDLKGVPFDKKLITRTYEGIDLNPIYTKNDIENNPLAENFPGFENFVRGSKPDGHVKNNWYVSQELPYPTAEEFNEALRYDLERGQTSINIKLDKATLHCMDPDMAEAGEVGIDGTSLSCINDLEKAFNKVDLQRYHIFSDTVYNSLPFFSLFAAYLKKHKIDKVHGCILADPYSCVVRCGQPGYDTDSAFDDMYKVTKWCIENNYDIKTIGVNGTNYVNAGASAVQELAYVISTAIDYINRMLERGLKIDEIAPRFNLTFGISTFYFMEVAKLRAARILWSNVIDAYKGKESSKAITIHGKSSLYNQTQNDIYVNLLRTTTEAFSAIAGGVNSLHTNAFDESLGTPDEFSRRLARNTQIILQEESHLNSVIDPAGGSYYIESLTAAIAKKAWQIIQSLDKEGGMLEALKKNIPQSEIAKTAEDRKKDFAKRKNVIVGNNMYANVKEDKIALKDRKAEEIHRIRSEYIKRIRVEGNTGKHGEILEILQSIANNADKTIDLAVEAYLKGATIGEIGKTLPRKDPDVSVETLNFHRASEIFEELRDMSFDYKDRNGYLPKIFLATMGPVKQHKARADFARGFFEVGGFDVIYRKGFDTAEEAAEEAKKAGAAITVICSTDDTYPELVPALMKTLKAADKNMKVILAGYPKEQIDEHRKSGIYDFIYLGADVYKLLKDLLTKL
ncbi:MAG: acyl-CoA mutase large subunit family protein [Bacteroidetes bacterium]|nr:acyl-CoA mutase large subunit family protein [Bacteroidota bacterium]